MSAVTDERNAFKLDELGVLGRGKSKHRPRDDQSLYDGDYPFFQTGDIKAANLYLSEYRQTYNEKGLAQSKMWPPGTLCITIAANIAETAILGVPGCFPDSVVGFVPDPEKADVRFIKYSIDTVKLGMQSVSHGTTQDNLSLEKLRTFDFLVPPLPIQQRIAGILSAYDDLIENNRRRIRILEEMARALYREWFVEFRFPGHEKVGRVSSSLGPVPEGWEVKRLGDILDLKYGKALRQDERRPGNVPVFGSSGVVGYHAERLVAGPGIIVGRKGNIGSIFWCDGDYYPIDTVFYVTASVPLRFLFYDLQTKNFINTDAAVPGLSRHQAYFLQTILPPPSLLARFCEVADGLEGCAAALRRQVANLGRTRDALLPRVLSGQVPLKEPAA